MVSRFVLIGLVLAVSACSVPTQRPPGVPAAAPPPVSAPTPPVAEPDGSSEAVQGLLSQARDARAQGSFRKAETLLQRAQRIAPRDGQVYLEYALLYDSQGDAQEAGVMAERGLLYCNGQTCRELRQLIQ